MVNYNSFPSSIPSRNRLSDLKSRTKVVKPVGFVICGILSFVFMRSGL